MEVKSSKYAWHGIPVQTRFGLARVKTNKEKPLYWYNYEVAMSETEFQGYALISAIEVTTENSTFLISNHFGIGVLKLIKGGWPSSAHFSFDDDAEFTEHKEFEKFDGTFDLDGYEKHEAARRRWQKENFPEDFDRSERLRKLFKSDK